MSDRDQSPRYEQGPGGLVAPVPRGLPVENPQIRENLYGLEQVVLGGMLGSREVCAEVAAILTAGAFTGPGHDLIFEACLAQATAAAHDGKGPAEYGWQAVGNLILRQGNALAVGGLGYLQTCTASVPTKSNAVHYAWELAEQFGIRQLGEVFTRGAEAAQEPGAVLVDLLERGRFYLDQVAVGPAAGAVPAVGEITPGVLDRLGAGIEGVPVPYTDLEDLVPKFENGQVVVIAGRPGIGKSIIALDVSRHAAIHNDLPVLHFTLEMSHHATMLRLIAAEAMVAFTQLRKGELTRDDEARIARRLPAIMDAPLFMDDRSQCSDAIIRMHLNQLKAAGTPAQMVVIDYLQLMATPKASNRQEAVSELSRNLVILAKEYNIPVIVCAQLNRGPEARQDKKPALADLRESGAIEQDASVVILLHRPEAHDRETEHLGEMFLIVAKNRNGETGEVTVRFLGRHMKCAGAVWSPSAKAEDAVPAAA